MKSHANASHGHNANGEYNQCRGSNFQKNLADLTLFLPLSSPSPSPPSPPKPPLPLILTRPSGQHCYTKQRAMLMQAIGPGMQMLSTSSVEEATFQKTLADLTLLSLSSFTRCYLPLPLSPDRHTDPQGMKRCQSRILFLPSYLAYAAPAPHPFQWLDSFTHKMASLLFLGNNNILN